MTEQGKEPFMKIDGYLIQVLESDKTSSESSECEDPINIPMEDTIPSSNIPESRYRTEMLPEEIANILGEVNRGEVPPISELELEEEMRELGDLEELPASVKEVVGGGKGGIGSIRDVEGEIQTEQMVHIKEEEVNVIVKKEGAINELLEMDDLPLDSDRTVSEDEDYRPGEGKDKHKRVEIYKRRERHVRHKRLRRNSGHGHNSDNSQTTYSKVRSRGIEKNRNPDPEPKPKPKPKGNHKSNHKPHKEREYRYSSESEHSRISYSSNSPEQEITKHSHSKHHLNTHKSYPKHNQHLRGTKKPDHARLVNKQVIHFGLPSKPHLSWDLDPHLSWDVDHYPYSLDNNNNNNNNNGAPNNVDHMENRASTTKGSSSFLQSNQELRSRDRNFDFLVEENGGKSSERGYPLYKGSSECNWAQKESPRTILDLLAEKCPYLSVNQGEVEYKSITQTIAPGLVINPFCPEFAKNYKIVTEDYKVRVTALGDEIIRMKKEFFD